jgi:hypothetical protein
MKRSDLSKVVSAAVLSTSLALLPLTMPSYAQSSNGSGTGTRSGSNPSAVDNTTNTNDNRGFDWGWLGLLGLLGLAGLAAPRGEVTRTYTSTDEPTRTNIR